MLVAVDTREPHPHARSGAILDACEVCGARARRPCEPVFRPWVWGECRRDAPYDERPRVYLPAERVKLDVGDYSVRGIEGLFAIERKSLADLLGTLFGHDVDALGERANNKDRFRAELERARSAGMRLEIVVESSVGGLYEESRRRWERYGKSYDAARVEEMMMSWWVDLGVPTWWAGSRSAAERIVGWSLTRAWSQASGGEEAQKAVGRGYSMPWLGTLDGVVSDVA